MKERRWKRWMKWSLYLLSRGSTKSACKPCGLGRKREINRYLTRWWVLMGLAPQEASRKRSIKTRFQITILATAHAVLLSWTDRPTKTQEITKTWRRTSIDTLWLRTTTNSPLKTQMSKLTTFLSPLSKNKVDRNPTRAWEMTTVILSAMEAPFKIIT